ncbi:MAG: hypothetical protein RBQ80_01910, partial [Methanocorpusculum sp.]|nr:hypothetical protein [Methanocorpusculum sp.]
MKAMLLFQQLTLVAFLVAISSIIVCPAAGAAGNVSLDIIEYTIDYDQVTYVPDMVSKTYSDYYADKLRYLLGTADGKVSDYAVYGGKAWPIPNSGDYKSYIDDKNYSASPIKIYTSKGCMAYASYCTVIFENITINTKNKVSAKEINVNSTASGLKKTIEENAQVGEHLRFQGDHDHSIIYIIEDKDKEGFYYLDSNGVKGYNANFKYTTYDRLNEYCNQYNDELYIFNTYSGKDVTPTLSIPTISTEVPQSVSGTTAILTANLLKNGGYDVTNCGFVYGTNQDNLENEILKGYMGAEKGIFTVSVDNLSPSTKYYYCAFAKNSEGTGFGDVKSFVTGPGKFSITKPLNGDELSEDNNIDLIWTKSDSATGYYVSLNKTSEVDSKFIDRYNCGNS